MMDACLRLSLSDIVISVCAMMPLLCSPMGPTSATLSFWLSLLLRLEARRDPDQPPRLCDLRWWAEPLPLAPPPEMLTLWPGLCSTCDALPVPRPAVPDFRADDMGGRDMMRFKADSAIWSRTLLKSSRKKVSAAHLKTSASCAEKGQNMSEKFAREILSYPPIWIDTALCRYNNSNNDVHNDEHYRQHHGEQHGAEPRAGLNEPRQGVLVVLLDDKDKLDRRKDPPRVAHQGLDVSRVLENDGPHVVEVSKVGVCLEDPVGLHGGQGQDEEATAPSREEGLDL